MTSASFGVCHNLIGIDDRAVLGHHVVPQGQHVTLAVQFPDAPQGVTGLNNVHKRVAHIVGFCNDGIRHVNHSPEGHDNDGTGHVAPTDVDAVGITLHDSSNHDIVDRVEQFKVLLRTI